MSEELMNFGLVKKESSIIKVIGVGGGGGNAVNYMYQQGIKDVDFVICNTDAQALAKSDVPKKIQLGESLTEGRGAGNKPEKGEQSAIENLDDVIEILADNTKMVFITAGMGGGTGTGAAPIIAKAAKDMKILTVGIVTIPFPFEGNKRISQAVEGIRKLKESVDSLLVIDNGKLSKIYGDLKLSTAFSKADDVLATAAKGIAEIITLHGYINVDFEDVKTVMTDSGVAVMGSASAEGEGRAVTAIREALTSPLLDNNDVRGANSILLNITSGTEEITMDEIGEITDYVYEAVGDSGNIIWGTGQDDALGNNISVTIIATGFEHDEAESYKERHQKTTVNKTSAFKGGKGPAKTTETQKLQLELETASIPEPKLDEKLDARNMNEAEIQENEEIPAYKRKQIDLQRTETPKTANVVHLNLDDFDN
ncbi:cell division protein FtsZ [Ancylomarina sp. 16SWW S1-10-2]|uniref:cell division protein FtsZ n=1 Tax=Ancylomarina sp. 16SWW S1-10-2 TaxID=2499681 RepID=UPI0012ADC14D|nr:cell division protein FtsZ [Ancylomarina sp. 16SWW S1-10-2]MRT94185.1 cell division protein FtsZ [Ancylomarina sp. 16SWW S1-10-2]